MVLLVLLPVCKHVSYLDLRLQEERKQSSLSPLSERSLFPEIHIQCMSRENKHLKNKCLFGQYSLRDI